MVELLLCLIHLQLHSKHRKLNMKLTIDVENTATTHSTDNAKELLQAQLDQATVLICHNAQHELIWLWDTGFEYNGSVFDTMLVEYLFQRGQKIPLSLEAVAERWELDNQKMGTLKEQLQKGISVDQIDGDELETYCLVCTPSKYY